MLELHCYQTSSTRQYPCSHFVAEQSARLHVSPAKRLRVFASSTTSPARSRGASPTRDLIRALIQQACKESLPWLRDLIDPITSGPPELLTDTVSPRALADPDSCFADVDGVTLHYKDTGAVQDRERPAVLLLHGFNGCVFSWRNCMQPMSEAADGGGMRVLAVDRPPFGLSDRPTQWDPNESNPYTTEGNARLALGLLQKLGIKSAILVGHSQGALTALEMYKQNPAAVAGFILVAPALPGTSSDSSWTRRVGFGRQLQLLWTRALLATDGPGLQYVRRQIRDRAAEVREGGNLGVFADEETSTEDLIEGYLKPMRAHDWDRGSLYSFRAMSFPAKLPYESITPPVLIVAGEKDRMLTRSAKQVSEVLKRRPNAITEYIELESCGHVPMDEMPEQFMAAVTPFMQQVASQRPAGRAGPDDEDAGAEALQDVSDQPLQAIDMTRTERDALPVEPSLTS